MTVGMASVLLGTMNRVMIVELSIAASLVAAMIALLQAIAPFRALLGFKSDNYRSALGWKRIPYLWFGSLWQFGGLSIMPCSGGDDGENAIEVPFIGGVRGLGLPLHRVGPAQDANSRHRIAADRARKRPACGAPLCDLLIGMVISAIIVGALLRDFSELHSYS